MQNYGGQTTPAGVSGFTWNIHHLGMSATELDAFDEFCQSVNSLKLKHWLSLSDKERALALAVAKKQSIANASDDANSSPSAAANSSAEKTSLEKKIADSERLSECREKTSECPGHRCPPSEDQGNHCCRGNHESHSPSDSGVIDARQPDSGSSVALAPRPNLPAASSSTPSSPLCSLQHHRSSSDPTAVSPSQLSMETLSLTQRGTESTSFSSSASSSPSSSPSCSARCGEASLRRSTNDAKPQCSDSSLPSQASTLSSLSASSSAACCDVLPQSCSTSRRRSLRPSEASEQSDIMFPPSHFLHDLYGPYRLLRFLTGYQFQVPAALQAFKNHLRWREAGKVDLFMREYIECAMLQYPALLKPEDAPLHRKVVNHFPINVLLRDENGAILTDKMGNIISVERPGLLDEKRLAAEVSNEDFLTWHTYQLEFRSKLLDRLSLQHKRLVKAVLIFDLTGLSTRSVNRHTFNLLRQTIQVSSENYPEAIANIFFVNTPKIFAAIWNTMKGWVTQRTISKISLIDSDFEETLLKHIDKQCLPPFLGGVCTSPLAEVPRTGYLSNDKFSLGGDKATITVGPRKKEVLSFPVTRGKQLFWSWGVQDCDVGFSIKFKSSAANSSAKESNYLRPLQKYDCSKTVRGWETAPDDGAVIFTWDNTWGLLQPRVIHYKIEEIRDTEETEQKDALRKLADAHDVYDEKRPTSSEMTA